MPRHDLALVDRLSRSLSTCADLHRGNHRIDLHCWLTPGAKSGVAVNLVSIPAVMVDIVQFNQVAKEQSASASHSAHANMYRRLSRPNVSPKIANWTIFHEIVASRCRARTCGHTFPALGGQCSRRRAGVTLVGRPILRLAPAVYESCLLARRTTEYPHYFGDAGRA